MGLGMVEYKCKGTAKSKVGKQDMGCGNINVTGSTETLTMV